MPAKERRIRYKPIWKVKLLLMKTPYSGLKKLVVGIADHAGDKHSKIVRYREISMLKGTIMDG